ncbi:hypothetical protein FHR22_002867 [Sphingopyxis panaciterrae]|uniref:hypothetical protein n=1 Tax=Sphingopyxis panaciterrae TaxID=363841 RepID=UPI0014240982|nr:hypothetical protein [Sphingopyxis panaciterrae]NIJ38164.1 hypothetical protein [Sphingopyxis panaciterrae]
MTDQRVRVTIVNHAAIDIAASPAAVWQTILDEYIEAKKFRELGYAIEPLDDPAACLGGYRMRFEQDGAVVDERICHVTERDEAAHRLSMFADYLAGGMIVYATYHADEAPGGTRYRLDCHSTLGIDQPAGAERSEIASAAGEMKAQFGTALTGYLESIKAKLETQG